MSKKSKKNKKFNNQNQENSQSGFSKIPDAPKINNSNKYSDTQSFETSENQTEINSEEENLKKTELNQENIQERGEEREEKPKIDFKDIEIKKLKELLAQQEVKNRTLQEELIDWKEKSGRIYAEMQAITKQHDLEIAQSKKSAKKNIASGLLDFLNTLQISFSFMPQTDDEKVNKFTQTLNLSAPQICIYMSAPFPLCL